MFRCTQGMLYVPYPVHNVWHRLVCSGLRSRLAGSLRARLGSKSSAKKLVPILLVSLAATFSLAAVSCTLLPHPSAPNLLASSVVGAWWLVCGRSLYHIYHVHIVVSCCVCALGVGGSVPRARSLLVDTFAHIVFSGWDVAPLSMRSTLVLALLSWSVCSFPSWILQWCSRKWLLVFWHVNGTQCLTRLLVYSIVRFQRFGFLGIEASPWCTHV